MEEDYPRWQKKTLQEAMKTRRVLLLSGPRQCGKTTLAKSLLSEEIDYRSLDQLNFLQAAQSDPLSFVKHESKMLIIDEIQLALELLPAIKQSVDENRRPGQFLLTGSADLASIPQAKESLAGRIRKVRLRPLSFGEIERKNSTFLERAFEKQLKDCPDFDRELFLQKLFIGGFPEPLTLDEKQARLWHMDYINALLERDLKMLVNIRRQDTMQELLKILAAYSSRQINLNEIASKLSIHKSTLDSYANALGGLFLIERLNPWSHTDYGRIGKQKKTFFTDTGLLSSCLNWNLKDLTLQTERLGKITETFVFNELSCLIDCAELSYSIYHYRDREKREIDFIIEREDGAILAIEVKASKSIKKQDFQHLQFFQKKFKDLESFTGLLLYCGKESLSFAEKLYAAPIASLYQ